MTFDVRIALRSVRVKEELVGKAMRCANPECKKLLTIPTAAGLRTRMPEATQGAHGNGRNLGLRTPELPARNPARESLAAESPPQRESTTLQKPAIQVVKPINVPNLLIAVAALLVSMFALFLSGGAWVVLFVLWIGISPWIGYRLGQTRAIGPLWAAVFCVALGWLGLLIVLCFPYLGSHRCPYCRELVREDAIVCRHCRRDLAPDVVPSVAIIKPKLGTAAGTCAAVIAGIGLVIALLSIVSIIADPPTVAEVYNVLGLVCFLFSLFSLLALGGSRSIKEPIPARMPAVIFVADGLLIFAAIVCWLVALSRPAGFH